MRILITLLLLFFLSLANAQKQNQFGANEKKQKQDQFDLKTYNAFIQNDYDTVIKLGNESLKQNIDFYNLRYRMAVSYFEMKNFEAAIPHLVKLKSIRRNDAKSLEYLYYCYIYTNQDKKALKLTSLLSEDPKNKLVYTKFADIEFDRQTHNAFIAGHYNTTIELGNEALKRNIDFHYLRYRMAVSYFEMKNFEAAIPHFEKAKSFYSTDATFMEYLYYCYIYTNQVKKAIRLTFLIPKNLKNKLANVKPENVRFDYQTYNAFTNCNYSTTIQLGKEALKQNIDFYNLRYRMAISYFEMKDFEGALIHFKKIKDIYKDDATLLEYLYYCYVFTGQNENASEVASIFPDALKKKINHKRTFFKSISAETGILKTNNNPATFKDGSLGGTNNYGHGTFYSDVSFANISMINEITPNFRIQNNLLLVKGTTTDLFQTPTSSTSETKTFTNETQYLQWNVIASYFINGWRIGSGFGMYRPSYTSYTSSYIPTSTSSSTTTTTSTSTSFSTINTTTTNYSGSISLSKRLGYIEPLIAASYANFSDLNIFTTEASLTYFPLGNTTFYGNSKLGVVSSGSTNNTIFSQLLGLKLSEKIYFEGYGAYGNHLNYISDNGNFVFNTPNKINWYAGSNLNFYFNTFDFTLGYGVQERGSSYERGTNSSNVNSINYTYNYNLLRTKFIWKF